jgi:hypothetical protein
MRGEARRSCDIVEVSKSVDEAFLAVKRGLAAAEFMSLNFDT